MNNLSLFTAFAAGLVSFLSPCVLPLIPGYVSFISGISLQDLKPVPDTGTVPGTLFSSSSNVRRAFWSSCWFVLGFSLAFIALGASATALGALLLQRIAALKVAAGGLIVVFGLHLIGIFRIPFLQYEKKIEVRKRPLTSLGALWVGAAFAFGWTPCIGPILAGILGLASTQETIGQGMVLLTAYSAGLGLPFLATSIGVQVFFRFFSRFRRYLRAVEVLSGVLLLLIGVLMITDRLGLLARYLGFFNRFAL